MTYILTFTSPTHRGKQTQAIVAPDVWKAWLKILHIFDRKTILHGLRVQR